jgi:nitrogenase molybdenum-cofactor synthesis protein NifE
MEVVYGGEKKLYRDLRSLIAEYKPRAAFVYSTCIVGLIGDDVEAVCRRVSRETNIPVLPVSAPGFQGTKKDGYRAACEALFKLVGTASVKDVSRFSVNILGDFNIAGEIWTIKKYYEEMGIQVVATMTGDGRVGDIRRAHGAALNVVQCSGSMSHLAELMKNKFKQPFIRVSYFGFEDMAAALYQVADFFGDPLIKEKTAALVKREIELVNPIVQVYRRALTGKTAAIYVGGAFKAFSLVRALRLIGMETAIVGTQTGGVEDYQKLKELCSEGTIIVDDSNPVELSAFLKEKKSRSVNWRCQGTSPGL